MLLAIDVGNTNITFGVFKGKRLTRKVNIPTCKIRQHKGLPGGYNNKLCLNKINSIIMCSVVPDVKKLLNGFFRKKYSRSLLKIVGRNIKVPIKNLYNKPYQVGQDRLVNAYAVVKLYKTPSIIVDFGTAITFDFINRKNEYEGGIIFPGVDVSLDALIKKAALLSPVKLNKPRMLIGKNTASSIKSGVFYGFSSMTDNMIDIIKKNINKKDITVVGTGGSLAKIKLPFKKIDIFDCNLTLKGLNLLASK